MKRLRIIAIICTLITITYVHAKDRYRIIQNDSHSLVEIVNARKGSLGLYYLKDSLDRNWSAYTYVEDEGKEILALVSNYASEVFLLQGDSLIRQGWSENHYALQHSAYDIFNGVIFGYGGYGYWTSKNILRYWNAEKGWVPILISDQSPALIPSHNSTLLVRDSMAIIIGGERTNSRNPFLRDDVNFIQIVNLNNRMVEQIEIEFDLGQDQLLLKNDTLLVFKAEAELISFNPLEMTFSQTVITEQINLLLQNDLLNEKYEEKLINFLNLEADDSLDKRIIWLLSSALILLLIFVFRINQKSNRINKVETKQIFIKEDTIILGENSTVLTTYEIDILNYLMENRFGTTQDLNSQFSTELSNSHLNKLRSEAIKGINRKVQILSNNQTDELIRSRKAKKDSRMFEYFIDPEYQL
jgi:hypothetical protein